MQTRTVLLNLFIIIALSIICILINPVLSNAQDDSVDVGINYLLSTQNPDGSWSEGSRQFLDTYTALESLLFLNINNAQVSQAVNWVSELYPDVLLDKLGTTISSLKS